MGNTNNTGKLIGALFIGAAIGGALGILLAPDKGSETRKKISAKGSDLTDAMKSKVQELLEQFKKDADTVKEKTNEFMENGKAVVDKIKLS